MITNEPILVRGCGKRKANGIYAEVLPSPDGIPLERFLMCPAVDIDAPQRGVAVVQGPNTGAFHIVDRIGTSSYPYPADFVEEARRFGISRQLPPSLPWHLFDERSRLILVHPRAVLVNPHESETLSAEAPACYANAHGVGHTECTSRWWNFIGDIDDEAEMGSLRHGFRQMPSFKYHAYLLPDDFTPEFAPGVIGVFPISRIAVIDGDQAEERLEAVSEARIPVVALPL